jgi:membrane associated rhomboid family serine protease
MFIPIGDENPTERKPFVNFAFIGLNILCFGFQWFSPPEATIRWTMVPAHLDWVTVFTSMFLHADLFHLIFNMLFLWIFGDNVEDRLGHIGYIVFYFFCGIAAAVAHIAGDPTSELPTLGASGAVSGVMGAYIVFYPRHHVKTFVWIFIFAGIVRTPAFLWLGIWFFQQVLYNMVMPHGGGGGVAYLAHIGGFAAGAAVAVAVKAIAGAWASSRPGADPSDRAATGRRIFSSPSEEPGIEFMDQPGDGYSVLRLSEDPRDVSRISDAVAPITGESSFDVVDRLVVTHGVVARAVSREIAGTVQRTLQGIGIPSAVILHNRSNFPPKPVAVESASWDARAFRIRAGDQVVVIPWTGPFLCIGARIQDQTVIDVFVNRRTAYRIADARGVALREVARDGRAEVATDLGGFARAIIDRAGTASLNDGIKRIAAGAAWDRLDFRSPTDYDDYVFWKYNLVLDKGSRT